MISSAAIAIGAPSEFWITQWKLGSSDNPIVHRAGIQEVKQHLCGRKKGFSKKSFGLSRKSNETDKKNEKPKKMKTEKQSKKFSVPSSPSSPSSPPSLANKKRKRSNTSNSEKNEPLSKKSNSFSRESLSSPLYPIPSEIPLNSSQSIFPQVPIPPQSSTQNTQYTQFLAQQQLRQQQFMQAQLENSEYLATHANQFSQNPQPIFNSNPSTEGKIHMWGNSSNAPFHLKDPVNQIKSVQPSLFSTFDEDDEFDCISSFWFLNEEQDQEQWSSGEEEDLVLSSSTRQSRSSSWDHLKVPLEFFNETYNENLF